MHSSSAFYMLIRTAVVEVVRKPAACYIAREGLTGIGRTSLNRLRDQRSHQLSRPICTRSCNCLQCSSGSGRLSYACDASRLAFEPCTVTCVVRIVTLGRPPLGIICIRWLIIRNHMYRVAQQRHCETCYAAMKQLIIDMSVNCFMVAFRGQRTHQHTS